MIILASTIHFALHAYTSTINFAFNFYYFFFLHILRMKERSGWWLLCVKKKKQLKKSRKIYISVKCSVK